METKISTLAFALLMTYFYISCSYLNEPDYTYKWKVAIVYTNGDKDTLSCQYDSFNGNKCYLTLKISENGLLSSGGTEPCIVMGCGFYKKPVVCGVRKYEILKLDTIRIK